MRRHTIVTCAATVAFLVVPLIVWPLHAQGVRTEAGPDGPAQIAYPPPSGHGRVVILISGSTGSRPYEFYAAETAGFGYYAVLLDGRDILNSDKQGSRRLNQAIERAQRDPAASPGKVAVVGFSLGGGGALAFAARESNLVSGVIAYYPTTSVIAQYGGVKSVVGKMTVPVLIFAGGMDTYHNCCLVETARTMAATAKELGVPLQLVVYPNAKHAFNVNFDWGPDADPNMAFDGPASGDAWKRTVAALEQYLSP
jgi:dienelactone hydrolase